MALEVVKHYLELYKTEKETLILKDDELAIRELVAEYEKEIRASFADKKAKDIATKESEIVALEILISRIEADEAKKREEENARQIAEIGLLGEENFETNNADETENVLGDVELADL